MNASRRKQYLHLGGEPIFLRTIRLFNFCPSIDTLYLVVPKSDVSYCEKMIEKSLGIEKPIHITTGGDSRQASVYQGLLAMERDSAKSGVVAIHDGVRPLVEPDRIESCITTARKVGACILGIPAKETLKQMQPRTTMITGTMSRDNIWIAQTPQAFQYNIIRNAHEQALEDGVIGTDDAMLVERLGIPVKAITGGAWNIKITTQEDLVLAEALLNRETGA
jgi:2-C-methyl-D-erythritol 4-phosphate cytidylyltransferase